MSAIARYLTAAITIASWIAVCNHCTFAAVAPKTDDAGVCPFHSKAAKPQQPPAATQCCKVLRAVSASPAKVPACAIVDLARVDLGFAEPVIPSPTKIPLPGVFLDTGPPGTTSFVELFWSMRAHAPPALAA